MADGNRVLGRYTDGGPCGFDPTRPVLDGEFEGKVLVGTVTLCQTGPACEERAYSILAFYDAADGTFTADVKVEPGCESPALKDRRLVLRLDKEAKPKPKPARPRPTVAECQSASKRAGNLLIRRDHAGAAFYYEQSLLCDENFWPGHFGRGVAELRRGALAQSLASLERAKELVEKNNVTYALLYYNLGCLKARLNDSKAALANLKLALDQNFDDPAEMSQDPDLQSLRDNPEFKALLDRAWDARDRAQKDQSKKDTP